VPSAAPATGAPAHGPIPPGDLHRIALDNGLVAEAIGWKPWTHLEDGLRETGTYLKGI
jgi:dTDP-D-glucose 4,6-dehydratase